MDLPSSAKPSMCRQGSSSTYKRFKVLSIPKFPDFLKHNISEQQAKMAKQKGKGMQFLELAEYMISRRHWNVSISDTYPQRPPSTLAQPAEPHRPASTQTSH